MADEVNVYYLNIQMTSLNNQRYFEGQVSENSSQLVHFCFVHLFYEFIKNRKKNNKNSV